MASSRERYSIFIEPHLKSKKGTFHLTLTMHQFPISWEYGQGLGCPSVEVGYALKAGDKEVKSFVDDAVEFDNKNKFSVILYFGFNMSLIGRNTGQIPLELLGANPLQQQCVFTIDIRVLITVEFFLTSRRNRSSIWSVCIPTDCLK